MPSLLMGKNLCYSKPLVLLIIPVLLSASLFFFYISSNQNSHSPSETTPTMATTTTTIIEKFGVKIERNPPQSKLTELGISTWPKWGCSPSKFPWTFSSIETMYLLEGKVKVYCDGHDEFFEIGGGDLVEFPKGMKVVWDVTEAVNKHYSLDE